MTGVPVCGHPLDPSLALTEKDLSLAASSMNLSDSYWSIFLLFWFVTFGFIALADFLANFVTSSKIINLLVKHEYEMRKTTEL